ncbi:DUF1905 domain-containing protein [Flammeovirga sp. MY04]|uniref:YdeI/OmpD-associated family protein n=1 Tax=Flammeovirga sp. MY04 TaxID=1191459 RepID=UPI0008061926|nr:YdeI/OmpD-associated family protein [Flammeovirga sp. MY04]ANQ52038.1 DUF1905 domain-containing protein [Flammeovirga sp. MY04]
MIELKLTIQKFEGKGGWSYVDVPGITSDRNTHFGWVTVSGSIDGYPLEKVKLMPKGDGLLFLPIKKEIRKKIKKEQGDEVHIKLYLDNEEVNNPDILYNILLDISDKAAKNFKNLHRSRQRDIIQRIFDNRNEDVQTQRINELIVELESKNV